MLKIVPSLKMMLCCAVCAGTLVQLAAAQEPAASTPAPDGATMIQADTGGSSDRPALAALPDGSLLCVWQNGSRARASEMSLVSSRRAAGVGEWSKPERLRVTPSGAVGNPVLHVSGDGSVWLFYQVSAASKGDVAPVWQEIRRCVSADGGSSWGESTVVLAEPGLAIHGSPVVVSEQAILLPVHNELKSVSNCCVSTDNGATWRLGTSDDGLGAGVGAIEPDLVDGKDGKLFCWTRTAADRRLYQTISTDNGRTWKSVNRPSIPNPGTEFDAIGLESGNLLLALNPLPEHRQRLSVWLSTDGGRSWPIHRNLEEGPGHSASPSVVQSSDGQIHVAYSRPNGGIASRTFKEDWVWEASRLNGPLNLDNSVPPLESGEHAVTPVDRRGRAITKELPMADTPFLEHIRRDVWAVQGEPVRGVAIDPEGAVVVATDRGVYMLGMEGDVALSDSAYTRWAATHPTKNPRLSLKLMMPKSGNEPASEALPSLETLGGEEKTSDVAWLDDTLWVGTQDGLFAMRSGAEFVESNYVVEGPLTCIITALAADLRGNLWVGTPLGLSRRDASGKWSHLRGRDGLPVESITAIDCDDTGNVWIGTHEGVVMYRPDATDRKWFYRAGPRYLVNDHVNDIAAKPDGSGVFVATDAGLGRIDLVETTLLERAQTIEARVNQWHRRLGLVAECTFDNAMQPTSAKIGDNDNDGLWTAYHVAAMSLAYGATGDPQAKASAQESMKAIYMLQNASGAPGLIARSVVPLDVDKSKDPQWRLTPDGKFYWKSDTSSDEMDGHYLAFYTYFEHVAQFDEEERQTIMTQVRAVTDYLVDNNYQLIDWDGERTRWGFWNPENLNGGPEHYLEQGLNSLQMLSFLKVAYYITGDAKYQDHYRKLIVDHGYLNNVLLEKKVFPDEVNHSDDQLGFVAWYPILQIEHDPEVRAALHKAVRRHARVELPERSSFFQFVYATIDPMDADTAGAMRDLREIPTDRRQWAMRNSNRADVHFASMPNRFGEPVLSHVLPVDERSFAKWNGDPFEPDGGGSGQHEDDGAAYLLPYWMGRYHGFITEPTRE